MRDRNEQNQRNVMTQPGGRGDETAWDELAQYWCYAGAETDRDTRPNGVEYQS